MTRYIPFLLWALYAGAADRAALLTWWANPETNITHYTVLWGTNCIRYDFMQDEVGTNTIVTGLKEGNTYYFSVIAWNDYGLCSEPADPISLAIPVSPTNPRQVTVTLQQSQAFTNWVSIAAWKTNGTTNAFWRLKIE